MMVDIHRALDPTIRERLATRGAALTEAFGTPGFMAPEQEREGIVTVRTDVYGLGATLRVAASGLSLPPDLVSLLGRMTGPVTERPQDMREVARLLSDVARREGVDCEEMRREQPPAKREYLSAVPSKYLEVPAIFCLRVLIGPHAGTVCALNSARVTVGRSADNDIVLTRELSLSRSHFALNWSAEQRTFVAIDFGANAPVLINGEPLASSRPLAPGDVLTIGSTQLVFERTTTSRAT